MAQNTTQYFQPAKEKEELKIEYPTLQLYKRHSNYELSKRVQLKRKAYIVEGTLPLTSENETLASYNISIFIPDDFPRGRPVVYCKDKPLYTSRTERHINKDYSACLCVNSDYKRFLGSEYTIAKFITKLVLPFFKKQYYFDRFEKWPDEARPHGKAGVIDFIAEHTGIRDENFAIKTLRLLAKHDAIDFLKKCPCGSNKPINRCHGIFLWILKDQVAPEDAKIDLLNFDI